MTEAVTMLVPVILSWILLVAFFGIILQSVTQIMRKISEQIQSIQQTLDIVVMGIGAVVGANDTVVQNTVVEVIDEKGRLKNYV